MQRLRELFALSIPFYVTRKNADGLVATWSVNGVLGALLLFLFLINLLVWLVIALAHGLSLLF